jgi:hypothetical protein
MAGSYQEELRAAKRAGASKASDAGAMALYCESALMHVVGAASPQLVWEGAQKSGMTTAQLIALAVKDPNAVHELMWL